jgi:limonene-1,2-epoxide hydrolase
MGNIVINDRIDYFVTPDRNMEFRIVGLFYVKDGKIVEWQDYTMPA